MASRDTTITDLVHGFARHIKALKSAETKEATIRQNGLNPIQFTGP